jgi:dolichyl-phosphate beta-glucosyltransferase
MPDAAKTWIVVPCYNEAERLPTDEILRFVESHPELTLLFVDDGSTDATRERLETLREASDSIRVLVQSPNQGKAEAVRQGMNAAFEAGADHAGYWDADLATPLDEILRFREMLEASPEIDVLFGSRVMLLGRRIERRATRHYLGRVGATAISLTLQLPVYDTQCGAKLFRVTAACREVFAEPFATRWVFDVEIIARMIRAHRRGEGPDPAAAIREVPLRAWRDVAGSKVRALDFVRSMVELLRIRSLYLHGARG